MYSCAIGHAIRVGQSINNSNGGDSVGIFAGIGFDDGFRLPKTQNSFPTERANNNRFFQSLSEP